MEHFCREKKCLGGHATSEDAEPTKFWGAINYGDPFRIFGGRLGAVVTGAAAADHNEIVVLCHSKVMRSFLVTARTVHGVIAKIRACQYTNYALTH